MSKKRKLTVCEVISRFLYIYINRLIKIRKYNFPYLVDKQRKSVFYLGFGVGVGVGVCVIT